MGAPFVPVFFFLAVTDAGQTKAFGVAMGGVAVRNAGPNTAFLVVGGAPPAAGNADGVYSLLMNETLNLSGGNVGEMSAICSAGQTAALNFACLPAGGAASL